MSSSRARPAFAPWGFFLVTFGFSWAVWCVPVLMHFGLLPAREGGALVWLPFLGAFGPMVGALVMLRRENGRGAPWAHLRRVIQMSNSLRWYVMPVLLFGVVGLVVWGAPLLWGGTPQASFLPTPWVIPAVVVFMVYLGGGQEEIGWRGFALDRLLNRHNDLVASLILGVVWALWHVPLWFMAGTSQGFMPFGAFLIMILSLSVILTWVYVESGRSMFLAMWTHGVANAYMAIFPVLVLAAVNQYLYWIFCCVLAVVAVSITLVRGASRRSGGTPN
ncbi:CAAX prenyl protease-like protein [Rhodoglobus vestalii]|uniref:CAAX prenyl protease-like protein n=1 Tax=Rhodoglobus vestalii TaxID=193384 RepID=A0A8H2K5D6_9MICO|nr:CPBP family intramembrane glutamic endopeptidase [Rhodoglobus vestalii]TQO19475.1 CAAX prenyl protease-like protein [Rhodoglobus vestalii]